MSIWSDLKLFFSLENKEDLKDSAKWGGTLQLKHRSFPFFSID